MLATAQTRPIMGRAGGYGVSAQRETKPMQHGFSNALDPTVPFPPANAAGGAVLALNANVLVLNKFYQAIRVINVKRAFSMLCKEMAEVIHIETDAAGHSRWLNLNFESWQELSQLKKEFEPDEYDWIHTVRFQVAVPRIIRLLGYDKLPRQDVKFNRRNIYARDSNRCQYCGKKFSTTDLSLDHVVPRSQGGKTTWENIVCCCVKCNVKKGGRTPEQAHLHLITKPVKPKRSPVINIRLADERYWSWKQFLDNAYWTVELK
jgi:5-methylcytosine-specific restriction endonuclease McrA